MNDPMRLVDAGATDFERLLLNTAAEEEPSSELSARMLAGAVSAGAAVALLSGLRAAGEGIAVSGSTAVGSSGASVAAAAATGAGGSIAPPAAAGLAGAWVIKWVVTLTLVAGAAVAGWTALEPGLRGSAHAPAAPARVTPQGNVALPAGEVVAADTPRLGSADTAEAPSQKVASAPAPRVARAGARALGPEIDLLDSARRALEAGDAEGALGLIASYRRRFPAGALEQEATVLEMDALAAKGRSEQATDLKEQFLAEHPESAHTQRVKRSGQTR